MTCSFMRLARYLFAQLALEAAPEKRQDLVVEQLIHERRKRSRAMTPLLRRFLLFYTHFYSFMPSYTCLLHCASLVVIPTCLGEKDGRTGDRAVPRGGRTVRNGSFGVR